MTPVDKYAAIRALLYGVKTVEADMDAEVVAYRDALRTKGGFETDWGDLTFRKNPPKIRYNEQKKLAWAQEKMPHEVIPEHEETIVVPATVRPTLDKTLESRLKIVDGEVVDTETGELVDFATVEPGKPDSPVFTMPAELKAEAARQISERVEDWAFAMTDHSLREVAS